MFLLFKLKRKNKRPAVTYSSHFMCPLVLQAAVTKTLKRKKASSKAKNRQNQ